MQKVKFIAMVDNTYFEFDSGSKCLILDYSLLNCFAYDRNWDEILEYVELVNQIYLKDDNATPLAELAEYVAENWDEIHDNDYTRREILNNFYNQF